MSCQQRQPGNMPDPNTRTAAGRPPLLYFPAVLPVRFVRISLLTSGAKRARTADLLHAIWRQHVHPRPYPQVTVLPRPCKSPRVRVSCCTSVLYRCHPRREPQSCPRCSPDQRQPSAPGYRCVVRNSPSTCTRSPCLSPLRRYHNGAAAVGLPIHMGIHQQVAMPAADRVMQDRHRCRLRWLRCDWRRRPLIAKAVPGP